MEPVRILLVSTYELGHQPWHVASPAAVLIADGHEVQTVDLAVEALDDRLLAWAEAVAVSVPMHTAMRIAVRFVDALAESRPDLPVALYGLYAGMTGRTTGRVATFTGEYEPALRAWAAGDSRVVASDTGRVRFVVPERSTLPSLRSYAHLEYGGRHRLAGYVESSHGCRHRCRHCPVPVVYDGTYRIVEPSVVAQDVAQLVAMGAEHITLGDPDFLNGPHHARRVLDRLHTEHPGVTFDVTVKVEHLLQHAALLPEFAERGVVFVVSAFETTNDSILDILDKGHTAADLVDAVAATRDARMDIRPSLMPFTPWTELGDLVDIFDFLADQSLLASVDPIQLTIRLLVPDGSLLLGHPAMREHLTGFDPAGGVHTWRAADPRVDRLQQRLAAIATEHATGSRDSLDTLEEMWSVVLDEAGLPWRRLAIPAGATAGRPRLTEPWFC